MTSYGSPSLLLSGDDRSSHQRDSTSNGTPQTSTVASSTVIIVSQTVSATTFVTSAAITSDSNSGQTGNSASITNAAASPSVTSPGDDRDDSNGSDGNRTTVIVLSTVLSVVGCLLIAGAVFTYIKCHRRRAKLFNRGITPIDDDEIATWKSKRREKELGDGAEPVGTMSSNGHQKHESVGSIKKPASVIVYSNPRRSEECSPKSPRTHGYHINMNFDGGKMSFDKELPQTPVQARAPNAREGLTDEAIPGDEPYIQSPRRQASRLSKGTSTRQSHNRTKSARSSFSLRSLGDAFGGYNSEVELTPRVSQDYQEGPSRKTYSRVFSSSSIPPRLSLSEDWPSGGLAPRPLIRNDDIGRAIG